jgi:acyl-ACP thioesterase
VLSSDGLILGHARSTWALIDVTTRQPADLTTLYNGELAAYSCDEPCPIKGASRARVTATEPVGAFTPLYCDIDYNGHLNSVKYIEHILNELPLEIFRSHTIHRVEVGYSAECFYRENLSVYMDKKDDGHEYDVEIRKDSGEVACRAKIIFKLKTDS